MEFYSSLDIPATPHASLSTLLFGGHVLPNVKGRLVNQLDVTHRRAVTEHEKPVYDVDALILRHLSQRKGEWVSTVQLSKTIVISREVIRYHADKLAKAKKVTKKRVNNRFIVYKHKEPK